MSFTSDHTRDHHLPANHASSTLILASIGECFRQTVNRAHRFWREGNIVRSLLLVFGLPIGLLCLGCGGGAETGSSGKKYRIAVIPKGTTHVFWKSVHAGAEQAA